MKKVLGIFDSGLGGLTVLKEILKNNSYDKIVFLGDTKRMPYGEKTREEIFECAKSDVDFLLSKGVDDIVVACGTVSSNCLNDLKMIYKTNIYGIIDGISKVAVNHTHNNKVGVIATGATIASKAFEYKIKSINEKVEVFSCACPKFVRLIESGNTNSENLNEVMNLYLSDLKKQNIDTLILGCTHFPILEKEIGEYLGGKVKLLNCGDVLKDELFDGIKKTPEIELYVTGDIELFKENALKFINIPELNTIKKAII